jgi:DNA ligase 1
MPNGVQFGVGSGLSDAERTGPPAIGSVITFRYQELSDAGVPRFPMYVGIRVDHAHSSKEGEPIMHTENTTVRRFEFVGGSSSKFWEIRVSGNQAVVRFGRIGTNGQTQTNIGRLRSPACRECPFRHAATAVSEGFYRYPLRRGASV